MPSPPESAHVLACRRPLLLEASFPHQVVRTLGLDTYGCISLVNFIRRSMAAPDACPEAVAKAIASCHMSAPQSWPWRDEMYLSPVLSDDPLLYSLAMGMDEDDDELVETEALPAAGAEAEHAREMMAEMRAMQAQMAEVLGGLFGEESDAGRSATDGHAQASGETAQSTSAAAGSGLETSPAPSGSLPVPAGKPRPPASILGSPVGPSGSRVDAAEDLSYFASYARLGIHEEMLADHVGHPRHPPPHCLPPRLASRTLHANPRGTLPAPAPRDQHTDGSCFHGRTFTFTAEPIWRTAAHGVWSHEC